VASLTSFVRPRSLAVVFILLNKLTGAKVAFAFFLDKTRFETGFKAGVCAFVSPKQISKSHAARSIKRRFEVIEFFVCELNSLVGGGGPSVGRGTNLLKDYAEIENFNAKNCFLLGK
jgi:hypothetical protein